LSHSETFRLLATLEDKGLVEKDVTRTYRPGLHSFQMAQHLVKKFKSDPPSSPDHGRVGLQIERWRSHIYKMQRISRIQDFIISDSFLTLPKKYTI
jgi:hypothetical protein